MELNDVLNGPEPVEEPVDNGDGPVTSPTLAPDPDLAAQPRDDAGRFAPKGENQPAAAAAAAPADAAAAPGAAPPAAEGKQVIPEAALVEERRRRQAAEDQVAQLVAALQGQQQQPVRPQDQGPALIPSIYEDEDGFARGLIQHAVDLQRQQMEPVLARELLAMKRDVQEDMARSKYADYDEKVAAFVNMAKGNQALLHAVAAAPNAAEFAYTYANNAQQVQTLGSLPDLATLRAQIRAEVEAELKAPAAPQPDLPNSLADQQSARAPTGGVGGPPSLNDILGRR